MKKTLLILLMLLIIPVVIEAQEKSESRYFKTTTYYNNFISTNSNTIILSTTEEISEEEFNKADISNTKATTVETTYKKMTAKLTFTSGSYKYSGELYWKNIPSTRSYDIFGIGFKSNILPTNINFSQEYCIGVSCYVSTTKTLKTFTNGIGVTFKLPTGNLVSLKQNFSFIAQKKYNQSITSQQCVVDYAHATHSVTSNQAQNYTMDLAGLHLDSSIINKYDTINYASVTWSGSW